MFGKAVFCFRLWIFSTMEGFEVPHTTYEESTAIMQDLPLSDILHE
jgi:hypothetical protein